MCVLRADYKPSVLVLCGSSGCSKSTLVEVTAKVSALPAAVSSTIVHLLCITATDVVHPFVVLVPHWFIV